MDPFHWSRRAGHFLALLVVKSHMKCSTKEEQQLHTEVYTRLLHEFPQRRLEFDNEDSMRHFVRAQYSSMLEAISSNPQN